MTKSTRATVFLRVAIFVSAAGRALAFLCSPLKARAGTAVTAGRRPRRPRAPQAQAGHNAEVRAAEPPRALTEEEEHAALDMAYPTPRFAAADDEHGWLAHLNEHGYAIVNLGLEPRQLQTLKGLLWSFLEQHADGWRRGEPATWTDQGLGRVGSPWNGVLNGRGVGHCDFLWAVRTLPAVRAAFARIWGVSSDDEGALVTSFDGGNVFRSWNPSDPATRERKTNGGWWHVDQGKGKAGERHAVQGLVTLFDANASTGGLCVVPGSHVRHAEVVRDAPPERDFVKVPPHWPGFTELPGGRRLVCARAGDLVLWDSRTVHCNAPGRKPVFVEEAAATAVTAWGDAVAAVAAAQEENAELLRAVAYVCMTPKEWCTPEVLTQRKEAYSHRVSTSHWPHLHHPGTPGSPTDSKLDLRSSDPARRALVA